MSLKSSMLRNLGASTFSKFAGLGCTILSVPILIAFLGVEQYGAWLVISAVPTWLAVSDVGLASVTANEMSIRASKNDWVGAEGVFQSAFLAIIGLSTFVALLLAILTFTVDWQELLNISIVSEHDLSIAMLLLGLTSLISLQGGLANGLYRAVGRAEIPIVLGGGQLVVDLFAISLALFIDSSVLSASIGWFSSRFTIMVLSMIVGFKYCPKVRFGFQNFNYIDLFYCLKKGVLFCLFPLSNALVLQGTTLIINSVLGLSSVVVFNTCRTMMRSGQQLMNLVGQSAWPEFSHLIGKGDIERARKLHHLMVLTNTALAILINIVLLLLGPELYRIWVQNNVQIDRWLILCFSFGTLGNALWFAGSTVVIATNKHERLAIIYLLAALIILPVCYYSVKRFGIYGGAFASIIGDLIIAPIVIQQALKITCESQLEFSRGLLETGKEYFILFKNRIISPSWGDR